MARIQLLLFIMIILTLLNGLLFFKKLIKLQEETNDLLKDLCDKNNNKNLDDSENAMPSDELEKLKASFMGKRS